MIGSKKRLTRRQNQELDFGLSFEQKQKASSYSWSLLWAKTLDKGKLK
jgi:hypothetical protein